MTSAEGPVPAPALLVVRVWYEPGQSPPLRARLLQLAEPDGPPVPYAVAAGVRDTCDAVERWLVEWCRTPG